MRLVCCSRVRWLGSSGAFGPGGVCGGVSVRGRCCGVFGGSGGLLRGSGVVGGGVFVVVGLVGCSVVGGRFVGRRWLCGGAGGGRPGECGRGGWCSFVGGVCGSVGSCRRSGGSVNSWCVIKKSLCERSVASLELYSRSLVTIP